MTKMLQTLNDEYPTQIEVFAEMLGYREGLENQLPRPKTESTVLGRPWRDVISTEAYDFCVRWETGGKAYYNGVIKGKPIWPGYSSGITIGCGYDLGYHTLNAFRSEWGNRIALAAIERLEGTIGFYTAEPKRSEKVIKAKQLVKSLSDIVIDWDTAITQFDESKMPDLVGQLYRALDNLDRLHPHSRGALLSLTFNRGAGGFTSSKERFKEMREIAKLMKSGKPADFHKIPALLREMTRIWGSGSSLSTRRKEEADLFEKGLNEVSIFESLASLSDSKNEAPQFLAENHEDVPDTILSDRGVDEEVPPVEGPNYESTSLKLGDVKWNPNDDEQPDYRHLPKNQSGETFDLTAEDLENLIAFNSFSVLPGLVVFALRGAKINGADKRINVKTITLTDIRPDHRDFRCVIGVLDRKNATLSAFKASTVPNAGAVLMCHELWKAGKELSGNVLPTGCYTYTCGTHKVGQKGEIKGVLRLSKAADGASQVVVLRSQTDVVYDRYDLWDLTAPADNIHPGRFTKGFSSEGCLTLPGNYSKATEIHTGLWADFRVALGMKAKYAASDRGQQFSCILLTGLDAAIASNLRQSGDIKNAKIADPAMRRLRFGSHGAEVAALQKKLGLSPDNSKMLGPVTRKALVTWQQKKTGWADGIVGPE